MSWFSCICGHIIRDQTDDLPYKARYIIDAEEDWLSNSSNILEEYIQARIEGRQDEFVSKYLGCEPSQNISNSSIIYDIISMPLTQIEGTLYECENCGRLWLQEPGQSSLLSYCPEGSTRGVFKKNSNN